MCPLTGEYWARGSRGTVGDVGCSHFTATSPSILHARVQRRTVCNRSLLCRAGYMAARGSRVTLSFSFSVSLPRFICITRERTQENRIPRCALDVNVHAHVTGFSLQTTPGKREHRVIPRKSRARSVFRSLLSSRFSLSNAFSFALAFLLQASSGEFKLPTHALLLPAESFASFASPNDNLAISQLQVNHLRVIFNPPVIASSYTFFFLDFTQTHFKTELLSRRTFNLLIYFDIYQQKTKKYYIIFI